MKLSQLETPRFFRLKKYFVIGCALFTIAMTICLATTCLSNKNFVSNARLFEDKFGISTKNDEEAQVNILKMYL